MTYAETHKAYTIELAQFHSADYVEFLHRITTEAESVVVTFSVINVEIE
jgi:hypothetical protein